MSIRELLSDSFGVIGRELPLGLAALTEVLSEKVVRITVDEESIDVRVDRGSLEAEPASEIVADASIVTGSQTISDVLAARVSLRDAVLSGKLHVKAELSSVSTLHEGLLVYTHAAVRCPGFLLLLARFEDHRTNRAEAPRTET
jgi:hypothetical protein